MPSTQQPLIVGTIDDLSEQQCLFAHCERCGHSGRLDLDELRERYGPTTLPELRSRLCCNVCGTKLCRVLPVWDGGKGEGQGT